MAEYTYRIINILTGEFYFGSRCRNVNLGLSPEEDLWINYFTSSKNIKSLIEKFGKESFISEIIYEQTDSDFIDAYYWKEQEFIKENRKNPLCLNRNYVDPLSGIKKFSRAGVKDTDEQKIQKSLKMKEYMLSLSEAEKHLLNNKRVVSFNNKTQEEKDEFSKRMARIVKHIRKSETEGKKSLSHTKRIETYNTKSDEEKLKRNLKISNTKKNKTQEEKDKTNAKRTESRAKWTEEEKLFLKQKKSKATSDYYKKKKECV